MPKTDFLYLTSTLDSKYPILPPKNIIDVLKKFGFKLVKPTIYISSHHQKTRQGKTPWRVFLMRVNKERIELKKGLHAEKQSGGQFFRAKIEYGYRICKA